MNVNFAEDPYFEYNMIKEDLCYCKKSKPNFWTQKQAVLKRLPQCDWPVIEMMLKHHDQLK